MLLWNWVFGMSTVEYYQIDPNCQIVALLWFQYLASLGLCVVLHASSTYAQAIVAC